MSLSVNGAHIGAVRQPAFANGPQAGTRYDAQEALPHPDPGVVHYPGHYQGTSPHPHPGPVHPGGCKTPGC